MAVTLSKGSLAVKRLLVPAVVLTLALVGCSRKSEPIIEVGSQVVTVADYEHAGRGAEARYPGLPAQAKGEFVTDLRRRALLLEQAHRLGHDTTSLLVNLMRDEENRLLLQSLYSKLAPRSQPVSEAEVRALYEARKQEAHVWLIYSSSRETALAAQARLRAGEAFSDVARTYSLSGVLPPTGDVGWIPPGAMPDPLDGALRTQPLNEAGGPYQTRDGWFVMSVSERRPREQGPFETQRAGLENLARQRKQSAALDRAYRGMKDDYDVKPAPGGSQLLFRALSPVSPLTPTPEMLATPLASYRGGKYTLDDALTDMRRADVQRPPFNLLPAIEIWIEAQVMRRVAFLEAQKRHIVEEPDVAASLKTKREQTLMEGVYGLAVATVPPPGPELVALAWERVKPQFTRLESARVAQFATADSGLAMRVVQAAAPGSPLADAVKKVSPNENVFVTDVHYPNDDPAWAVFQAMFTQQQVGAWFGPEKTAQGWRILQLVDKKVAQQAWEELPEPLRQNIAASASELARDQRFQQYTDSLAKAFQPRMHQDRIAKLKWPVAAAQ